MNGNSLLALSSILAIASLATIMGTGTVNPERWADLNTTYYRDDPLLREQAELFNETITNLTQQNASYDSGEYSFHNLDTGESIPFNSTDEEIQDFFSDPGQKVIVHSSNESEIQDN